MNKQLLEIAKPILFKTDMVKAILDGRKTQTRMIIKPTVNRGDKVDIRRIAKVELSVNIKGRCANCYNQNGYYIGAQNQIYQPDDILYVRETWGIGTQPTGRIIYKADYDDTNKAPLADGEHWRPSIHMPKSVARTLLRITNIRVERLRYISESDAMAEGFIIGGGDGHFIYNLTVIPAFIDLWNGTIKKAELERYGWNANPWVMAYEFERVE